MISKKGENMPNIENSATIVATLGDEQTPINLTSNLVTTTIVDGLTVVKKADKDFWADEELIYTIEVTNNSGNTLSNGVITDALDVSMIALDGDYGVKLNGVDTSDYKYDSGMLTVNLPTLANGEKATIEFQVIKNHNTT